LLFQNIKDHLPAAVLDRSKQGFVGPDSFYMNIDRYQQILDRSALIADGIVRGEYYQRILADRDHWRLWKLAVMETWYAHWIKN
jgi:asparagine synthase (glutamine-hydrolysing)